MQSQSVTSLAAAAILLLPLAACGSGESTSSSSKAQQPVAETAAKAEASTPEPEKTELKLTHTENAPAALDTGVDLSRLTQKQAATKTAPAEDVQRNPVVSPNIGPEPQPTAEPAASPSNARLTLADPEGRLKDFGEMLQGTRGSHVFHLISEGEDDLVISRIKPSCGCTIANTTLVKGDERIEYEVGTPIPPGTKIEVSAELKTEGRVNNMSSNISIYSNAPEGVINLSLKAFVKPVLLTEPESVLNFGRVTSAEVKTGEIRIYSEVLDPFMLNLDTEFLSEHLEVEMTPSEPTADGRSSEWKLNVTLGPGTPEGMRNFPILVKSDVAIAGTEATDEPNEDGTGHAGHGHATAGKSHEVRMYVQAQVTSMVSPSTSFVSFGMVRPGQEVERRVQIQCFDDHVLGADMPVTLEGLRAQEFPFADVFDVELTKLSDDKVDMTITLRGMPDSHEGSFGGVIKVGVGHPMKDELQVRFSGVCRVGVVDPAARGSNPGSAQGTSEKKQPGGN